MQVGEKPNRVRKAYEQNDLVPELVATIRKSKALDWLLHNVEFVDPDGNSLDRDHILGHTHDDHDHDDHDHDGHDHDGDDQPEAGDAESEADAPQSTEGATA
jgi:hypothetical protein